MPPSRFQRLLALLAIPALVLGVACLMPLGFFALFAIPVWIAAAGIVLYGARRGAARARAGRVATGVAMLLALVLLGTAGAASATAPGKNGSIAFRRFFDDQHTWAALITTWPDGSHTRQLTHPARGTVDNSPDWAPDGRLITFVRSAGDTGLEHLWTVRPDGSGLAPVGSVCPSGADETTCPDDTDPSFTPDSKQLTFVQASGEVKTLSGGPEIEHSAIAIANVDGSGRRVIYDAAPYSADLAAPMSSPDGRQILFERDNSSVSTPAGAKAVFVVSSDGTAVRRLTPWGENDGDNPDWSPDGKWILFHSHQGENDGRQGQYFLIHPDGTGRRQITHLPKGVFVGSASFSPDGRSIVFAKGPQGGNVDVYTMRLDGSHVHRLTRSRLWESAPDWGPVSASAERLPASAAAVFPSGIWRVTVTTHDLVSRGVTGSDVPGNRGVWNWTFSGTAWSEKQQAQAGGPVTDVHRGRIALHGSRVCFTDTGEKTSLGCYAWSRSGSALRFSKPTFSGELALGDGPGILKAIFIAHPWVHSSRALASARATALTVRSSIDGKTTFGHRIHWVAYPSLPSSKVIAVDFRIDGTLRWTEHHPPYTYGGLDGDNYLITSWLTPGRHRFTVVAHGLHGLRAVDAVVGTVPAAVDPPTGLAGTWRATRAGKPGGAPDGVWSLTLDRIGLRLVDPLGGGNLIDAAYVGAGVLEARTGIWMHPHNAHEGNGWCEDTNQSVRFHWSLAGDTLTLTHLGTDGCGESDVLDGDWKRS